MGELRPGNDGGDARDAKEAHVLKRILLLLSAVSISSSAPATESGSVPIPTRKQLKACPNFADLDFRRIAAGRILPSAGWREKMDLRHAQTRGPFGAFEAPADARITLRIWAGGSETQQVRTDTSSIVWLDREGIWQLDRVDYAAGGPPPPPRLPSQSADGTMLFVPYTPDEQERLKRQRYHGVLEPQRAYAIEATLRNPCFALQPDAMPFELPVKRGKPLRPPCSGVIGGTIEIRWADGRRRDVTELCGGFYAGGIISAVMYARSMAEDSATRAECDPLRGAGDLAPAQRRDRAFCDAGLAAELRKRGLDEAGRDLLARDALILPIEEMMQKHQFLSQWSAGALRESLKQSDPALR